MLHTQQGELLFAEQVVKVAGTSRTMPEIVAAKATLKGLAHSPVNPDPLQENDPWAAAAAAKRMSPPLQEIVANVAKQVEQAVTAKMQPRAPPVDAAQIASSVESSVLARLQPQIAAAQAHAQEACSKVQAVEGIASKVESQEKTPRALFEVQMSQIEESLTTKRPRQE